MSNYKTGTKQEWMFPRVPNYEGGICAASLYDAGYGNTHSANKEDSSKMQLVSDTDEKEFNSFLALLEEAGYNEVYAHSTSKVKACAYRFEDTLLYLYYSDAKKQARIIWDRGSKDDIRDFSYTYTAEEKDSTFLYGYGIHMSPTGLEENNCGMLQVIKLADNSLFVIDGAWIAQFDEAATDGFMAFCREITETPENEKIRISCWFITHNHADHYGGVFKVLMKYAPQISLERMATNLLPHELHIKTSEAIKPLLDYVNEIYPDCGYLMLHTGTKFNIANLTVEVIYTHEDMVSPDGTSLIVNTNDASAVASLTVEGVKYIVLGDLNKAEAVLMENFTDEELRADIVQISHHAWNQLDIYDNIQAKYAIFPQSEGAAHRTLGIHAAAVTHKVQKYALPENCFYSGSYTAGLLLKNGTVFMADKREVVYNSPDVVWKYVYEGKDLSKVRDYSKDLE